MAVTATGALSTRLLAVAAACAPMLDRMLREHADASLAEFVEHLVPPPAVPAQPREDLWEVLFAELAAEDGTERATGSIAALRADPVLLTANHLGIDTFADSVQGTLLLTHRPGARARPLVILGFGSISMNNLTYPMGLRLYEPCDDALSGFPQRLPVLPNRIRHRMVSHAPPFDRTMVVRARARVQRLLRAGQLTPRNAKAADAILGEDFDDDAVLALPRYRDQATVVNRRLWRRMVPDAPETAPSVVHIETVCAKLLAADLLSPGTLAHTLLFDPPVRESLLHTLDGAPACWQLDGLARRLDDLRGRYTGGTVFFWGVAANGKRVPLTVLDDKLVGTDDSGGRWSLPFTPAEVVGALAEGTLIPSLFSCFTTLAFARGVTCVGGYYQVDYLPVMQRGVVSALGPGHRHLAESVAAVPSTVCLSGLQGLARTTPAGVLPVGPVELAAAGGLTGPEREALLDVRVRDACLLAFVEVLGDLVPSGRLPTRWAGPLAAELAQRSSTVVCCG